MKGGPRRGKGGGGLGDGPSLPADWAWKGGSYQDIAAIWNAAVVNPFRAVINNAFRGTSTPPPSSTRGSGSRSGGGGRRSGSGMRGPKSR